MHHVMYLSLNVWLTSNDVTSKYVEQVEHVPTHKRGPILCRMCTGPELHIK